MLIGPNGGPYASNVPGTVGGHRGRRIYGRFDCAAARRAIARGGYVSQRVFFLNEAHAEAAGYRPCGSCLPDRYARWKQSTTALLPESAKKPIKARARPAP